MPYVFMNYVRNSQLKNILKKMNALFLFNEKNVFICILILAVALRLYRLPEMVSFDFDQEYAANFANSVLNVFPIQLIGQGLSVPGLFMGPIYFYFLVPFFALFNLNPIGGYLGSVVLGIITISVYYFVLRTIFSEKTALIAAFLRAILFSKVNADWSMVPSLSSELAVLLIWFFIYKYWRDDHRYLIPLGFVFGLFTSFHPIEFPFYIIFLIFLLIKRKLPSIKITLFSLVAFILPMIPLMVFEYFKKFTEIKLLLFGLGLTSKAEPKNLETMAGFIQTIFYDLHYSFGFDSIQIPKFIFPIIGFSLIFLMTYRRRELRDKFHYFFLPITIIIFLLYYYLLPTHVPEYYFTGVYTIVFIYLSISISLLNKKLLFVSLTLFSLLSLYQFEQRWNNNKLFTFYYKDAVVKEIVKREKSDSFRVTYIVDPGWQYGFEYLFKVYGKNSHGPAESSEYKIFLPTSITTDKLDMTFGNIGLILPKEK